MEGASVRETPVVHSPGKEHMPPPWMVLITLLPCLPGGRGGDTLQHQVIANMLGFVSVISSDIDSQV